MKLKKIMLFILVFIALFSFKTNFVHAANADFMCTDSYVSCGAGIASSDGNGALIKNMPSIIPKITSTIFNALMVIIPSIMIIMGISDMVRALASQNEDEIKKGRTNFIKRLIVGVLAFLVVLLTKFFVSAVSGKDTNAKIVKCIDCFVSNQCDTMKEVNCSESSEEPNSN